MFNLHFFSVETGIGMLVETVEGESQGGRIEALVISKMVVLVIMVMMKLLI